MKYEIIPRHLRKCGYSKCICDIDSLWSKPDYKVGQKWMLYGGLDKDIWTIEIVSEKYIVCSTSKEYQDGIFKEYYAFGRIKGEYADCGTPTLRIRV